MSYQILSSLDDFLFGYLFAGGATAATALAIASATSEMAVNYLHDLGWSALASTPEAEQDTRQVRTATFSVANAGRAFGVSQILTGNVMVSLGYLGFNTTADAIVYAANDMAWGFLWPVGEPAPDSARVTSQIAAIEGLLPSLTISFQHDDPVLDDLVRRLDDLVRTDEPIHIRLTAVPPAP